MTRLNLMTHCGSERIQKHDLHTLPTPTAQGKRHNPIRHDTFLDYAMDALAFWNIEVTQEVHALSVKDDGSQYFGMFELAGNLRADSKPVLGLRNSDNRSIAAGWVLGNGVLVCDNLCFFGEIKVNTKNTLHLLDRLPELLQESAGRIIEHSGAQEAREEAYKGTPLTQQRADHLLMDMWRNGAVRPQQLKTADAEWRNPSHPEFQARNVWRLFNAVTESHKSDKRLPEVGRSMKLVETLDAVAGVDYQGVFESLVLDAAGRAGSQVIA